MEKCYGYIRCSSHEQIKKTGPDRQEAAIKRCAKSLKMEIEKTFVDDISGTVDCLERPEFQEMLGEILRNGIKIFIVESLGRLARKNGVQEQIIYYLASKGITLISADTNMDITKEFQQDPMKKALINIMGIFWELEKDVLVSRLRAGRQKSGNMGGRPQVHSPKTKRMIKDMRKRGRPYAYIATHLNAKKIKTATGKPWSQQLCCSIIRY